MNKEKGRISAAPPKAFLQSRRPVRFSDWTTKEIGKLDHPVFEHQFSTLNRRNMELVFEGFAKKLFEIVVYPNLLEKTGSLLVVMEKLTRKHFQCQRNPRLFGI